MSKYTHWYRSPGFLLLALSLAAATLVAAPRSDQARDAWQRPQEVMDTLGLHPGSVVADIGCGRGYFTFHLARRVGADGHVYAVDVDTAVLRAVQEEAEREGWQQVETVAAAPDDPRLPAASLDMALIVNAYHEMREYDAELEKIFAALKPGGRLGIIDGAIAPGQPRSAYYPRHRIPKELVKEDAARHSFRFLAEKPGFVRTRDQRHFYFLLFEKPPG